MTEHIGEKIKNTFIELHPFIIKTETGYKLVRSARCPLLQDDGLCAAEAKLGRENKPYACRLFPFNFYNIGDYLLVRIYPCNNWQWYMGNGYQLQIENFIALYQEIIQKGYSEVIITHESYIENTLTEERIEKEIKTIFYDPKDDRLLDLAFNESKLFLPDDYDKILDFIADLLRKHFVTQINIHKFELEQIPKPTQDIIEGYLRGVLKYETFMPQMIATDFEDSVQIRNFIVLLGTFQLLVTIELQKKIQMPNPILNEIAWGLIFNVNSPTLRSVSDYIKYRFEIKKTGDLIINYEREQLIEAIRKLFKRRR